MQHNDRLKNPKVRAEHFKYRPGRPTDASIVETIRKRVRQIVEKGYHGGYMFTTEQLTYPLWNDRPHQHHYISQQISRLIEEYDLPIRWHRVKSDGHVLYRILLDS